mgnify:CR=1 FL=1
MIVSAPTSKLYFTSDTHFFHRAMAYIRGFSSIDEMNATLIAGWNSTVPRDGVVIHLGDLSFGGTTNTVSLLGQLHGTIHLVRGNHDRGMSSTVRKMFATTNDYLEVRATYGAGCGRDKIVCSHYSHRVWNQHHYGAWHLYGHSHGSLPGIGRSMDVGVDTNALRPYSFEKIRNILERQPIHTIDYHKGISNGAS